jgi:hypothetical protein
LGLSFFETSVITNQNIKEVFYFLTKEILNANEGKGSGGHVSLKKTNDKKRAKNECNK